MVLELQAEKTESSNGLADAIDRILDKGLVINADIIVDVNGTELLGIKIRAALASFETAARYGLQFPSGTKETQALLEAEKNKESCPQCDKLVETKILLEDMCPWCGWISAKAKARQKEKIKVKEKAGEEEGEWIEEEEIEIEV